jgi:hypothetical protein
LPSRSLASSVHLSVWNPRVSTNISFHIPPRRTYAILILEGVVGLSGSVDWIEQLSEL